MAAQSDNERKGPWIRRIGPDKADAELAAAYQAISRGRPLDHILEIHTLHPQSLLDHYALYRTSMCDPRSAGRSGSRSPSWYPPPTTVSTECSITGRRSVD